MIVPKNGSSETTFAVDRHRHGHTVVSRHVDDGRLDQRACRLTDQRVRQRRTIVRARTLSRPGDRTILRGPSEDGPRVVGEAELDDEEQCQQDDGHHDHGRGHLAPIPHRSPTWSAAVRASERCSRWW